MNGYTTWITWSDGSVEGTGMASATIRGAESSLVAAYRVRARVGDRFVVTDGVRGGVAEVVAL